VTKQWAENGLISRMLFSELYKIMVNKVTFVGFSGGGNRPNRPHPGSAPDLFYKLRYLFGAFKMI